MKLYLYTISDLQVFQNMLISDRTKMISIGKQMEADLLDEKILKIEQEKRRRLSAIEFVAGDDPSETKEHGKETDF